MRVCKHENNPRARVFFLLGAPQCKQTTIHYTLLNVRSQHIAHSLFDHATNQVERFYIFFIKYIPCLITLIKKRTTFVYNSNRLHTHTHTKNACARKRVRATASNKTRPKHTERGRTRETAVDRPDAGPIRGMVKIRPSHATSPVAWEAAID